MALKSARIARIENLPQDIKDSMGKEEGFAIVEITNSEPKENIKLLKEGGIRDYFLSLGDFIDVDID